MDRAYPLVAISHAETQVLLSLTHGTAPSSISHPSHEEEWTLIVGTEGVKEFDLSQ